MRAMRWVAAGGAVAAGLIALAVLAWPESDAIRLGSAPDNPVATTTPPTVAAAPEAGPECEEPTRIYLEAGARGADAQLTVDRVDELRQTEGATPIANPASSFVERYRSLQGRMVEELERLGCPEP